MGSGGSVENGSSLMTKEEAENHLKEYKLLIDFDSWWSARCDANGVMDRKKFKSQIRWLLATHKFKDGTFKAVEKRFVELVNTKKQLADYIQSELSHSGAKEGADGTRAMEIPEGWTVRFDKEQQCIYFCHIPSNQSTWDLPGFYTGAYQAEARYAEEQIRVPLPPGWAAYWDQERKACYFHNEVDGSTTWERPSFPDHEKIQFGNVNVFTLLRAKTEIKRLLQRDVNRCLSTGKSQESMVLPEGWEALIDEESGDMYFHHAESGETSWYRPENVAAEGMGPEEDDDDFDKHEEMMQRRSLIQHVKETGEVFALPENWSAKYDPESRTIYFEHNETGESSWENPSQDGQMEFAWQLNHMHTLPQASVYRGWTVTHEPERKWISAEQAEREGRQRWNETFAQQPLAFEDEATFLPEDDCAIYYYKSGTPEETWRYQMGGTNSVKMPDGWFCTEADFFTVKMKFDYKYATTPSTTIYAHRCVTRIQARFRGNQGRKKARAKRELLRKRRREAQKRQHELHSDLHAEREKHMKSHEGGVHNAIAMQKKHQEDMEGHRSGLQSSQEEARRKHQEKLAKRRAKKKKNG
eukprot:g3869.t1